MKKYFPSVYLCTVVLMCNMPTAANSEVVEFAGEGNGKSPVFSVNGPWTIDWAAHSEFPLLASFEMRLHSGSSGEIIGKVAEIEGTGRGLRLLEEAGTYQISIVGRSVEWDIEVVEVSAAQAERLKRETENKRSLSDSAKRISQRIPENSFMEWRSEGNDTLVLLNGDEVAWKISFDPICRGMNSATAISFVTPAANGINDYDSILLEDGTRCYFRSVTPGSVP